MLKCNPLYDYNMCNPINNEAINVFKVEYEYFDYNKYIVTAYESDFIDGVHHMSEFIKEQSEYIDSLSLAEKRILQDYTKNDSSFAFYLKWIYNDENLWTTPEYFNFGDSFYTQIYKILIAEAISKNDIANTHSLLKEYLDWLDDNRCEQKAISKFSELGIDFWETVLLEFKNDLNNIILNAPTCKIPLHFYRGVKDHYIKDGLVDTLTGFTTGETAKIFLNTRFSSFSLSFKIAHYYHLDGEPDKRCIYRITVSPGCKILYLPQLSVFGHEMEFLVPLNSSYMYATEHGTDLKPSTAGNHLYNPYALCSLKDNNDSYEYSAFNSYNVTLIATSNKKYESQYSKHLKNYVKDLIAKDEISNVIITGFLIEIIDDSNLTPEDIFRKFKVRAKNIKDDVCDVLMSFTMLLTSPPEEEESIYAALEAAKKPMPTIYPETELLKELNKSSRGSRGGKNH